MRKKSKAINPDIPKELIRSEINMQWHGPLPDPQSVEYYSKLYTEAPRIIFEQFESESKHQQVIDIKESELELLRVKAAIVLLGIFVIIGSIALFTKGISSAALFVSTPIIVALISVFRKKN